MSERYRYNHLRVVHNTADNKASYPDYPFPWFLLIDDDNIIVGDGPSQEAAMADLSLRRPPNTPSPKAESTLRRMRRDRRLARMNRINRMNRLGPDQ